MADLPTALSLSILDVKQPAVWDGDPEVTKHTTLTHFLPTVVVPKGHAPQSAAREAAWKM